MSGEKLLQVEGLSVRAGSQTLVREVSFALGPGECITLLGESGAGKSLLAQAVMGNLPVGLRASGRIGVSGWFTPAEQGPARRPLWGRTLALLPQEPALALDPLMPIAAQLAEVHALVRGLDPRVARSAAGQALEAAGLSDAASSYPWQVSGGMAQRAVATMALAGGARVLLADEPTKGLDARWRHLVVAWLQRVQREGGCVVTITHDLRVARALGGRIVVLRGGEVVEQGDAREVLDSPRHDYTRRLVAADPAHWTPWPQPAAPGELVLCARGLVKGFGVRRLFEGLDLDLHRGERLVVQGPSGIGKTTLGNVLLGLLPIDSGRLQRADGLSPQAFQKLYQDPVAAFAPFVSLERSLKDVARRHGRAWSTVLDQLERLRVPVSLLQRRPDQVSGGELQRVALARVLMVQPVLIFADEPTSRLDPITQQEAMAELVDSAVKTNTALVLVTHDDDIATAVSSRVLRFGESGWAEVPAAKAAAAEPVGAI
ncbi:MAG: ABC transporter ATP-binding protein [Caldimonas sp.]|uniref:ABC transporter ATP-binding protein n=1 Tax=Caldimonas taiwanensis TaxID=307483 RepID=UPI000785782A|nr:ATP-binding cassette domain-containing protein [Caldimonas taiwanensis]GIX23582.1 MAG: ABC transporter ATP-binding protein [Caldimonas sp.]